MAGVHSHIEHMIETARVLVKKGLRVAIHAFTDGRDVAPVSAKHYLEDLRDELPEGAFIATVSGRYYAMDRDNRWERVELAYQAFGHGERIYRDSTPAPPSTMLMAKDARMNLSNPACWAITQVCEMEMAFYA